MYGMVKKEDGNVGSKDPVRAILFLHFLQAAEKASYPFCFFG